MSGSALFEFELLPVHEIEPWGQGAERNLSWFALSLGEFRMPVGGRVLFEYTPEIRAHWGLGRPCADYQLAALAQDFLPAAQAGRDSLPTAVEAIARDRDSFEALYERTCDEDVWRWLGERTFTTGYLVGGPRVTILRFGDRVHLRWDVRDAEVEGHAIWTAGRGEHVLPIDDFQRECRHFRDRLLERMAARIDAIEAGRERPQIAVDVPDLRRQHERWREDFEATFAPFRPSSST